jgi:hypothetical protein
MKIQEEHINLENGTHYFEQIFTTQSEKKLEYKDYNNLINFLDVVVENMTQGKQVSLFFNTTDK